MFRENVYEANVQMEGRDMSCPSGFPDNILQELKLRRRQTGLWTQELQCLNEETSLTMGEDLAGEEMTQLEDEERES